MRGVVSAERRRALTVGDEASLILGLCRHPMVRILVKNRCECTQNGVQMH